MGKRRKIIFLAIDSGDKNLIQRWAQDGTMPTIHSLMDNGLVGHTESAEALYVGSTWPCFYTGVNPGRHGFHRLTQIVPGTYDFRPCFPGEFIKCEPFWIPLSRSGKNIAILDIPLSWITKEINGIQILEWGSHDMMYGFHAWPRPLKRDILKRFGVHPMNKSCDSFERTLYGFCELRDLLVEGVNRKCDLTRHFLKQKDWDFFAQVFTESQCIGHQCWHLHDPTHPNFDASVVSQTGDPIREVYRAIDHAIGKILKDVDEDTYIFFLGSHRMSHRVSGDFMMTTILEKLHYLKKMPKDESLEKQTEKVTAEDIITKVWHKIPHRIREALKPRLLPIYHSMKGLSGHHDFSKSISGIDLRNSRCFLHENGTVSGIRINREGREPYGMVKPGKEWNDLCENLTADLMQIVDADTGRPMVDNVYRTADLFQGDHIDDLPDILVEWNDQKMIGSKAVKDDESCLLRLHSDKTGLIEGKYAYCRTGEHRKEGMFIAAGPGIRPGQMNRVVSLMDFAPTFLKLSGVKFQDYDGEPIHEIF